MKGRKKNPPQKRKVGGEGEDTDLLHDADFLVKEMRKSTVPSKYPVFRVFKSELRIYYLFDSAEEIKELTELFGTREQPGRKTREWFGRTICDWRVYYKKDVENDKKEIIELLNVGCKLLNIGLEVKLSNIENAGYGLFATKDFAENDIITRYGGYYCNFNIFATHDKPTAEATYLFEFPREWGISGILDSETCFKLGMEMGRWVNSNEIEKQNVIPDYELVQNNPPMAIFRARGHIKAGEELYWWYGPFYAFTFTDRCIVCSKVSETKCEACEIPICGLSCHDKHIETVHQEN